MATVANNDSITVSLVAVPEASAAVVYGLHEVFSAVGTAWEMVTRQRRPARRMAPQIVAASGEPFLSPLRVPLAPDAGFDDVGHSDVVIVPDVGISGKADIATQWPEARAWLRDQYEGGAVVCSVCTGSLMLAAAGLLDGLEATTHWGAAPTFRDSFSDVLLRPERVLVPAGPGHRIVTSGGAASWADLALYLVARFSGEDEARRVAKIFLLGDRADGQLPFAMVARPRQHDDRLVSECQAWIASNYALANPVESMIEHSGIAGRTFVRRFKRATGFTPIAYVQTLRVEEAKQMLEATVEPVDQIAHEVGYGDEAAFRRLFKRMSGISPGRYRQKFRAAYPSPN